VHSVPITTKVVSSNPVHVEVYSIQQYMIKFVNDLRQVRFPPSIKLTIYGIHNEVRDFDKNSTQPEIRVNRVRDNESQLYNI
jgi:hypothetical protein